MARTTRTLALLLAVLALVATRSGAQGLDPLGGLPGGASGEPFELSADSLEFESVRNLYVASGHVAIVQGDRTLHADWVAFSRVTGAGVASGHVVLEDPPDVLHAGFVQINVRDLQGVVFEGTFDSERSRFRGEAERIARTGEQTYEFENGTFTTCRCPKPDERVPWKIRAEEADVEVGGYGTMRNTSVDIFGVPALWFPWMIYPVKTERQTGVLFPEIELASRNGFGLGLPLFWAARDDLNVTVTPSYRTKRGPKADVEAEYVFGTESYANLFGAYAYDTHIDPGSRTQPFDRSRWAAKGQADVFGPEDLRFQTDFRFASDNQYPQDFKDLGSQRTDRFLESTAALTRPIGPTARAGVVASAAFADDRQNPDDQDRDAFLLQRLPSVSLPVLPGPFAWLPIVEPSLDLDYTWFQPLERARGARPAARVGPHDRVFLDTGIDSLADPVAVPGLGQVFGFRGTEQGSGPDPSADDYCPLGATRPSCLVAQPGAPIRLGPEGDGVYEEGEPLTDRGHRIVLQPRLAAPMQLGPLELYPELGWHETLYFTANQDFAERGFATGRIDLRTRLERRFGDDLRHVLEPFAGWALALPTGQSDNPLFVPSPLVEQERIRELDLDSVTRDPSDRIARANRLAFGVANRLYGHAFGAEGPSRLLADVSLVGQYDFAAGGWGEVALDGRAYPTQRTRLRFDVGVDPRGGGISEGLLDATYNHPDGHGVTLGYRFLEKTPRFFEDFRATGVDQFRSYENLRRINQIYGVVRVGLTRQWAASYTLAYSFEKSLLLANQGTIAYTSRCQCWSLGLRVSDDRARGLEFQVLYSVAGLGQKFGQRTGAQSGLLDPLLDPLLTPLLSRL
jgi:lipopolysaccharide assembly outer membrane protein LptD (OstA)